MLGTQKHRQIQRLGDPNPMEDAPDQDSAQIPQTKNEFFCLPTRAILGYKENILESFQKSVNNYELNLT